MAETASSQLGISLRIMHVQQIPKISIFMAVTIKIVPEKAQKWPKMAKFWPKWRYKGRVMAREVFFHQCLWVTKFCAKFGRSRIPRTANVHNSFIVLRCMWKEPAPFTSACPGENNHMSCQGVLEICPDLNDSLLWARIARPPLRTMPQNWQLIPSSIHYVSSKGLKQNDSSWTENLGADVCWLCKHCVALYCAVQAVRKDCAVCTIHCTVPCNQCANRRNLIQNQLFAKLL